MRSFPLMIVAVVLYNLLAALHGFNPSAPTRCWQPACR